MLIATLATLMLTSGLVITGELLRITMPSGAAAPAAPTVQAAVIARIEPMMMTAASVTPPAAPVPAPAPALKIEAAPAAAPAAIEPGPELSAADKLAADLLGAAEGARKITMLGTAAGEAITASALELARAMAVRARVVLVDLTGASEVIAAASVDPVAPGLTELMSGAASFSSIITKDRSSKLHLVSAGRGDRTELQSPRLMLAIDALQRAYDHVLLDAGNAANLSVELLTSGARAVVVPDAGLSSESRSRMREQLLAVGFAAVTMLEKPIEAPAAGYKGKRGVAA